MTSMHIVTSFICNSETWHAMSQTKLQLRTAFGLRTSILPTAKALLCHCVWQHKKLQMISVPSSETHVVQRHSEGACICPGARCPA